MSRFAFIISLLALTISGCAGSNSRESSLGTESHRDHSYWDSPSYASSQVETLPPLTPHAPYFYVKPRNSSFEHFDIDSFIHESRFAEAVAEIVNLPGYRIQLFSGKDPVAARSLINSLKDAGEDEVYLNFEAPLYKVRFGNYIDRGMAKTVCDTLIARGFKDAWLVRTTVEVVR